MEELQLELAKVVACCLDIQEACCEWNTDIGVKLTVKIGQFFLVHSDPLGLCIVRNISLDVFNYLFIILPKLWVWSGVYFLRCPSVRLPTVCPCDFAFCGVSLSRVCFFSCLMYIHARSDLPDTVFCYESYIVFPENISWHFMRIAS